MVELEIAFRAERDDRFTVITRPLSRSAGARSVITETVFEHEDSFILLIVAADFDEETTVALVVAAILSVAQPSVAPRWTRVEVTEQQLEILELEKGTSRRSAAASSPFQTSSVRGDDLPDSLLHNAAHFYDFLMNAPTPFVMIAGPEYVFTFINPPYVQLLGRTSADQLLGLPVKEALPEPGFEVCLGVLDKAYKTGIPQARRELLNTFQQKDTGLTVEAYFDIVYHPVRDQFGLVTGVMAQATDVTERVLARQVSENREEKLYRLWAELENIYAAAPVGIALIRAADLVITRINDQQANLFQNHPEKLLQKSLAELSLIPTALLDLVRRAALGEKIDERQIELINPYGGSRHDSLLVSLTPSLGPTGNVEAVTLITRDPNAADTLPIGEQHETLVV